MKLKILLSAALILVSGLLFTTGQIFYYNKKITSSIGKSQIVLSGRLTANLNSALQNKLVLKSQAKQVAVSPTELKSWTEGYIRAYTGQQELRLNVSTIKTYLEKIAKEIDAAPTNARLVINEGRATEFELSQMGQNLNIPATTANIITGLAQGNYTAEGAVSIELVVDEIKSEVTLDKINKLGINELLASGESNFAGSPKSRIHNITVGSQKFTGITLKPGEEFSFNQFLGLVDAASDYLPELVIKNGTLIPEYGGGLCQVSTTLFRAAITVGLPILERHPHSLPVRYYNPQGFDATIYPGISDLRFKNDTPAYILIQSKIIGNQIKFEIYGTSDGRKITLDGPNQYDIKPNGSLKATLTRTVLYPDGIEKKDVFQSSYKAPGSFPTIRNPLE